MRDLATIVAGERRKLEPGRRHSVFRRYYRTDLQFRPVERRRQRLPSPTIRGPSPTAFHIFSPMARPSSSLRDY